MKKHLSPIKTNRKDIPLKEIECKNCYRKFYISQSSTAVFCNRECQKNYNLSKREFKYYELLIPGNPTSIKIQLTKNLFAIIDVSNYEKLNKYLWHAASEESEAATVINSKVVTMQSLLKNPSKNQLVIHKNGNRLDNRLSNLLLGTKTTVNIVRKKQGNNTSGYRGVSRYKKDGRWTGHIGNNGHQYFLGYFETAEHAAFAYNLAARSFWGELAYQNDLSLVKIPEIKRKEIWDKFNIHKDFIVRKVTESGYTYHGDTKKINKRITVGNTLTKI